MQREIIKQLGLEHGEIYEFNPAYSERSIPGWLLADAASQTAGSCLRYGGLEICRDEDSLRIGSTGETFTVALGGIRIKDTAWYAYIPYTGILPLEVRSANLYARLHSPRRNIAPTLLVNGLIMHRITPGWDPLKDAAEKARLLRARRNDIVLDTCMGLGYTAIYSLRRGAHVVTIEISREIISLAEHNPYSRELSKATILVGDAADYVSDFPSGIFNAIMHDPPRYNVAGELYSLDIYREFYRILRPGGVLVHYTGEPQRTRGRGHGPIVRGVIERLRAAGFRVMGYREKALSVLAIKPR